MTGLMPGLISGLLTVALCSCIGASPALAGPASVTDREGLATEYRSWLDHGRTPTRFIDLVRRSSPGFTAIDLQGMELGASGSQIARSRPGDRLLFVHRDRTAILVVVGEHSLASHGARLIGAHIDTPSPRLSLVGLTPRGQRTVRAQAYGGVKLYHWLHRPLALVGRVARSGDDEIEIALGLQDDGFALYASQIVRGELVVTTGSIAADKKSRQPDHRAPTLMNALNSRYGLVASDLRSAELYLVPAEKSREVGLDRGLIGGHGQDDRVNSYAAWRAIHDLEKTPPQTALVWLVDREEVGSAHSIGAQSRFFEMVMAYLLRAQGGPATELSLARALARCRVISADTPPALNPNWPEVHEAMNVPVLGRGPAMFPYTGREGKQRGSQARPELVRSVVASFERAGAALQFGVIGRVDEGGGGTIAKYLAERGMDVIDVGIPVVGMHSPLELTSKDDLWTGYLGFKAWLLDPT